MPFVTQSTLRRRDSSPSRACHTWSSSRRKRAQPCRSAWPRPSPPWTRCTTRPATPPGGSPRPYVPWMARERSSERPREANERRRKGEKEGASSSVESSWRSGILHRYRRCGAGSITTAVLIASTLHNTAAPACHNARRDGKRHRQCSGTTHAYHHINTGTTPGGSEFPEPTIPIFVLRRPIILQAAPVVWCTAEDEAWVHYDRPTSRGSTARFQVPDSP